MLATYLATLWTALVTIASAHARAYARGGFKYNNSYVGNDTKKLNFPNDFDEKR